MSKECLMLFRAGVVLLYSWEIIEYFAVVSVYLENKARPRTNNAICIEIIKLCPKSTLIDRNFLKILEPCIISE